MTEEVIGKALGRRAPKNARALMFAPLLTGVTITPPPTTDHFAKVPRWILGGNDQYGDCGPVSVANQRLLTTTYLTASPQTVTQTDIFDLYRRSGNPTFDPTTHAGDDGVDMQTMCEALMAGGVGGVKPLCFAKVNAGNEGELRAAIAIFGSILLGVDLEEAQQSGSVWDYKPSAEWGGHAICSGRYNQTAGRMGVVTWGSVVDMTDAFLSHQLSEAWVVVWPEHLGTVAFWEGIDVATLAADYTALTGKAFPIPVPTPAPASTPTTNADETFAAVLRPWVATRHSGANKVAAKAAKIWLAAKGLG